MIAILDSDAFAIAMLGVIFSGFGVLILLFLSMRSRVARRDAQVDQLLEELASEQRKPSVKHPEGTPSQPWEKDADWWKNKGDSDRSDP